MKPHRQNINFCKSQHHITKTEQPKAWENERKGRDFGQRGWQESCEDTHESVRRTKKIPVERTGTGGAMVGRRRDGRSLNTLSPFALVVHIFGFSYNQEEREGNINLHLPSRRGRVYDLSGVCDGAPARHAARWRGWRQRDEERKGKRHGRGNGYAHKKKGRLVKPVTRPEGDGKERMFINPHRPYPRCKMMDHGGICMPPTDRTRIRIETPVSMFLAVQNKQI